MKLKTTLREKEDCPWRM